MWLGSGVGVDIELRESEDESSPTWLEAELGVTSGMGTKGYSQGRVQETA